MRIATFILAIGMLAAAFCQQVEAGPFEDGLAAARSGDFAKAEKLFRPLANAGDRRAQYNLGLMYARGAGVGQDFAVARGWYLKSAVQGFSPALNNLGVMSLEGNGVPIDYIEAYKWCSLGVILSDNEHDQQLALMNQMIAQTRMNTADIAEARARGNAWIDHDYKDPKN